MSQLALLRGVAEDFKITQARVTLGRQDGDGVLKISDSKRMPRKACLIYLNTQTDLFMIKNTTTSQKTIFVDRLPLKPQETRQLQHKSLIHIADQLMFFLLPQETLEKRKRFLKERRKQIIQILQQPQSGQKDDSKTQLKGLGKRMNLDEVVSLWDLTRQEVHSMLGQTYSN